MTPYKSITRMFFFDKSYWWVRVAHNGKIVKPKRFYDDDYINEDESLKFAIKYRNRLERELGKIRTEFNVSKVVPKGSLSSYVDSQGNHRLQASVGKKKKVFSIKKFGEKRANELAQQFIQCEKNKLKKMLLQET